MKQTEEKIYAGVYKITCTSNNKFYIGRSDNLKSRLQHHFNSLKRNDHKIRDLQNDYNLYGLESFTIKIIKATENHKMLEANLIAKYFDNGKLCYNSIQEYRIVKNILKANILKRYNLN